MLNIASFMEVINCLKYPFPFFWDIFKGETDYSGICVNIFCSQDIVFRFHCIYLVSMIILMNISMVISPKPDCKTGLQMQGYL